MRLKTYTAVTTNDALKLVRDELGEAAVIVSTETDRKGGRTIVTAALDDRMDTSRHDPVDDLDDPSATLRHLLNRHGVPSHLAARITSAARPASHEFIADSLSGALNSLFGFASLNSVPSGRPLMLVGPPGVGKTVTVAKMATRAILAKASPTIITTDTIRAGAIEQLEIFTRILGLDLVAARTIEDLEAALDPAVTIPAFIDTAGCNPFDATALDTISNTARAIDAEPVLVLAGGGDAIEAAEIAAAFSGAGCRRMVVTRIDLTRRLGSLLSAADAGRLTFSDVSVTPGVADGLAPLESWQLADMLCGKLNTNDYPA